MIYFKINDKDYSPYVNALSVSKKNTYNAQSNAAGDTVVDYINAKRTISVGIIPLEGAVAANLLKDVDSFSVTLSFFNPKTNQLEEGVKCIIPNENVKYYTIRADKVMLNAFDLTFNEL